MKKLYDQFVRNLQKINDLEAAEALLDWDQEINMPIKGADIRSEQLATLASMVHELSISDELGSQIDVLYSNLDQFEPGSIPVDLIQHEKERFERERRIPSDWVARNAKERSLANIKWREARENSDYALFQQQFEIVIDLKREYAAFFQPYEHIYEPLLYNFEPGMKTRDILDVFDVLKAEQVPLINSLLSEKQIDNSFLFQSFSKDAQWDFGIEVINQLGFDFSRGRQDLSAHPFTTSFGLDDVRFSTKIREDYFNLGLFNTIHECGHAFYDMSIDRRLARTPLESGASGAIHESQSLIYENLVGRSLPFWKYFYPRLQQYFPGQLGNIDLQTFYKGINRVKASPIRVEADEATYNLHILLRFEIELGLLDGSMQVRDLPEIWNEKMKNYLGIVPENDSDGVLQDIHWSLGHLGYFPSYTIGNILAVQLWSLYESDYPKWQESFEKGDYSSLLKWLNENVHIYGARYKPLDLIKKISGGGIDPKPYIAYLENKYSDIYR